MNKPKVIALYLPQYHPTPDNDKWWGKGFTEWTNVGKAKPLFRGHYQPKVPADLGYYDLRVPEVREAQAQLAKEAGIDGFCYYHYWFGNGRQELELPFNEVLKSGKPDFPFMLCWANESWHKKFWNKDGKGTSKEVLIEQTYPDGDLEKHFSYLLKAFKDPRYIKVEGKPAFMIYCPNDIPKSYLIGLQELAKQSGLEGLYLIAQERQPNVKSVNSLLSREFNAVNTVRLSGIWTNKNNIIRFISKIFAAISGIPRIANYRKVYKSLCTEMEKEENIFPTLIPNWDHTPRSGRRGTVLTNVTPQIWQKHIVDVYNSVNNKSKNHQIVFIKSWNEWGEGNYIEPDIKYGTAFLDVLKEVNSISDSQYTQVTVKFNDIN